MLWVIRELTIRTINPPFTVPDAKFVKYELVYRFLEETEMVRHYNLFNKAAIKHKAKMETDFLLVQMK